MSGFVLKRTIRWPKQHSILSGIIPTSPIGASLVMIIYPDLGIALFTLKLKCSSSVYEGEEKSILPFLILLFRITIFPDVVHLGVECGQSTTISQSSLIVLVSIIFFPL